MKYLITFFLMFSIQFTNANTDPILIHSSFTSNIITGIDVKTGNIQFTAKLEEPVWFKSKINDENVFYAQTRHYGYKINATSGEVLDSYKFTEIQTMKKSDYIDPNLQIIPFGITKNGIGSFSIQFKESKKYKVLNPKYSKNLTMVTIETFDVNNKTTKEIKKFNAENYAVGGMPNLSNGKLYFSKPQKIFLTLL